MRGRRRRQVRLVGVVALTVVLGVGLWASVSRQNVPQDTMRFYDVHGSAEFYNLLFDSSVVNCSGGQPFKVSTAVSSLFRQPDLCFLVSLLTRRHVERRIRGETQCSKNKYNMIYEI